MRKTEPKPTTLEEAIKAFDDILTPEEQVEVISMTEKELIQCHHGLGRWIRNNWNLWQGGPLLEHMRDMGFRHPDDISQSMIREYWCRKNNLPSTMAEDIKKYTEYWEKQK